MVIPDSSIPPEVKASAARHKQEREIENRFTYHPPKGDQAERYGQIRGCAKILAEEIIRITPASREQSAALTKLDEVVFWANAAIARNE